MPIRLISWSYLKTTTTKGRLELNVEVFLPIAGPGVAMSEVSSPLNPAERLALANQLYREYRTRCFWHSPRDLVITEDMIPFVIKELAGARRSSRLYAVREAAPAAPNS